MAFQGRIRFLYSSYRYSILVAGVVSGSYRVDAFFAVYAISASVLCVDAVEGLLLSVWACSLESGVRV